MLIKDQVTSRGFLALCLARCTMSLPHHTYFTTRPYLLAAHKKFDGDVAIRAGFTNSTPYVQPNKNTSANAGCWLNPSFTDPNIQPQAVSSLLDSMNQRSHAYKYSYTDLQVLEWQKNPFNAHAVTRGRMSPI